MKLIVLPFFLLYAVYAQGQANSVSLLTKTGTPISQHNTVQAAYNAITAPFTDGYIIEMSATYTASEETYPIVFTAKAGASAANTITVRPAAGASILMSAAKSGANMVTLDDADYIVLDGRAGGVGSTRAWTITNTATTSNSNNIQLINGACNNAIMYCTLNNGTTTNTGRAISIGVSVSNTSGNSDNTFSYCRVNSGRYTINSVGTAANPNTRNLFKGCEVVNSVFAAFWFQAGSSKVTVDSCKIYHTAPVNDGPYGILFDSQSDTAVITRCNIYDLNSGTSVSQVKGISIRSSLATNYANIYNNFINLGSSAASINVSGIEITASSTTITTNARIAYNTIRVAGTLSSGGSSGNVVSAAFLRSGTNPSHNIELRNNIFVNERSGGTSGVQHLAMALSTTGGTYTLSNNTYNSASGSYTRYGTVAYTDLATYQAAIPGNDPNSNLFTVGFVSTSDLHLAGSSLGNGNLLAQPIADIDKDIDNETRALIRPYRGADENLSQLLPLAPLVLTVSQVGNDALVKWSVNSMLDQYSFEVERSFDAVNFSAIATKPVSGNHYQHNDAGILARSNYRAIYYRIKTVSRQGQVAYSSLAMLKLAGTVAEISAYPNPFKQHINVSVYLSAPQTVNYKLLNMMGAVVENGNMQLPAGNNFMAINLPASLPVGMYTLVVDNGAGTKALKLVKQ